MAILGCGNMGTAILDGILAAIKHPQPRKILPTQLRPSRFIACVNRAESVARLEHRYGAYLHPPTGSNIITDVSGPSAGSRTSSSDETVAEPSPPAMVQIWQNNTAEAVKRADVVLLACQPSQAAGILGDASLRQHLSRKLLLSICVGVSASQILRLIYGDSDRDGVMVGSREMQDTRGLEQCYVVHAMPNTASTLGQSATALSVIASSDGSAVVNPLPSELEDLAAWIFSSIGTVTYVSPSLMNAASVTGASTVAFFATALQGVVNGAIGMGLSERDALQLAAQAMKGTADMALAGVKMATDAQTWPGEIRNKVMTPNGCTARGIGVLDDAKAGEAFAEATKQAVERVFELGREASSSLIK
ncbi:delta 1-pyrroline-5-carboxylate reductase [Aspergillus hancockii]|nr:delta 1-pyrroline-5-carboxylate reductase [Aspergillus hancockii]